jgi:hypothetical protein
MSKSSPPVEDTLQGQRIQRMKEKIAQKAFVEVILQILFAIIVFSISYVNRDERAFRLGVGQYNTSMQFKVPRENILV